MSTEGILLFQNWRLNSTSGMLYFDNFDNWTWRELRIHNCIAAQHKPMSFEWFICLKPTGIIKPKWGLYSWSLATNTHSGIKIKAHPAGSLCQVLSCSDWLVRHMFDLIYCLAKHMFDLIGWRNTWLIWLAEHCARLCSTRVMFNGNSWKAHEQVL